jgi:hypothetical protein
MGTIRSKDLNAAQHVAVPRFGLAFGMLWLYMVYRFATIGIYVADGGLVVRGPYSTRRLAGREILGVSEAEWQPPLGRQAAAPIIELTNHEMVAVSWLSARSLLILGGDRPNRIVDGLRTAIGLHDVERSRPLVLLRRRRIVRRATAAPEPVPQLRAEPGSEVAQQRRLRGVGVSGLGAAAPTRASWCHRAQWPPMPPRLHRERLCRASADPHAMQTTSR